MHPEMSARPNRAGSSARWRPSRVQVSVILLGLLPAVSLESAILHPYLQLGTSESKVGTRGAGLVGLAVLQNDVRTLEFDTEALIKDADAHVREVRRDIAITGSQVSDLNRSATAGMPGPLTPVRTMLQGFSTSVESTLARPPAGRVSAARASVLRGWLQALTNSVQNARQTSEARRAAELGGSIAAARSTQGVLLGLGAIILLALAVIALWVLASTDGR